MGEDATRGNKTLAVSVNTDGDVSYDAILRQGANKHKTVIHSDHKALVPKLDLMDPKVRVGSMCFVGVGSSGHLATELQAVV
jgi:hypothetical protein